MIPIALAIVYSEAYICFVHLLQVNSRALRCHAQEDIWQHNRFKATPTVSYACKAKLSFFIFFDIVHEGKMGQQVAIHSPSISAGKPFTISAIWSVLVRSRVQQSQICDGTFVVFKVRYVTGVPWINTETGREMIARK